MPTREQTSYTATHMNEGEAAMGRHKRVRVRMFHTALPTPARCFAVTKERPMDLHERKMDEARGDTETVLRQCNAVRMYAPWKTVREEVAPTGRCERKREFGCAVVGSLGYAAPSRNSGEPRDSFKVRFGESKVKSSFKAAQRQLRRKRQEYTVRRGGDWLRWRCAECVGASVWVCA